MEIVMDICDFLFGIGNWLWAEYFLWVIVEGIIVPRHNGMETNGESFRRGFNTSYYQGKKINIIFDFGNSTYLAFMCVCL